ncbi:MAG: hypothetical protein HOQ05_13605, partial [Corynebacteriales bacterium]|nr:hypothetical protein [Mycobacteriales bacterium]
WDYVEKPEAFLEWASSIPKLFNPHSVLKWNADKKYLLELADAGVPIVPTVLVQPGQDCEFGDSGEFVIKPTVGIGALGVCRFDATFDQQRGLARVHAQQLLDAGLGVLVQPYQRGIEMYGETSLIYLGGSFSHAVKRSAVLDRALADVPEPKTSRIYSRNPLEAEFSLADQVFTALYDRLKLQPSDLLYARVDLVPGADGLPVLMELELIEPALFFGMDDHAADRFADLIQERLSVRGARAVGRVPAPRTASGAPIAV